MYSFENPARVADITPRETKSLIRADDTFEIALMRSKTRAHLPSSALTSDSVERLPQIQTHELVHFLFDCQQQQILEKSYYVFTSQQRASPYPVFQASYGQAYVMRS